MKLSGATIADILGRIRPSPRPRLLVVDASLVIVVRPDRWVVLPEFFRTGGDLAWNRNQMCLVWTAEPGEDRKIPLPAAPDLSALRTGTERKGTGKAWAVGILLVLVLPALWVRLFLAPAPGSLSAPARTGIPYAAPPSPGSVERLSGTGWMK